MMRQKRLKSQIRRDCALCQRLAYLTAKTFRSVTGHKLQMHCNRSSTNFRLNCIKIARRPMFMDMLIFLRFYAVHCDNVLSEASSAECIYIVTEGVVH